MNSRSRLMISLWTSARKLIWKWSRPTLALLEPIPWAHVKYNQKTSCSRSSRWWKRLRSRRMKRTRCCHHLFFIITAQSSSRIIWIKASIHTMPRSMTEKQRYSRSKMTKSLRVITMRPVMGVEATALAWRNPNEQGQWQRQWRARARRAEELTMMILTQALRQSSWICHRGTLQTRMKKTCVSTWNGRRNKLYKRHSTRSSRNRHTPNS